MAAASGGWALRNCVHGAAIAPVTQGGQVAQAFPVAVVRFAVLCSRPFPSLAFRVLVIEMNNREPDNREPRTVYAPIRQRPLVWVVARSLGSLCLSETSVHSVLLSQISLPSEDFLPLSEAAAYAEKRGSSLCLPLWPLWPLWLGFRSSDFWVPAPPGWAFCGWFSPAFMSWCAERCPPFALLFSRLTATLRSSRWTNPRRCAR